MINECRLFRAERFQLVLSKQSCGKGGRSPAMIHTENPNTCFALVTIKTCIYFFLPFSWAVGVFQAEIQVQPKEGCIFFYLQSKIAICHSDAKLGESLFCLSGWVCDGNFPFCTQPISRKDFSYRCSNRVFFFSLQERRYFREAAVHPSLCATQLIHNTFKILVPAPNFACEETWSGRGAWG